MDGAHNVPAERFSLASIFDASRDVVLVTDGEGRLRYANPAAQAQLGGLVLGELAMPTLAREEPEDFARRARDAIASEASETFEWGDEAAGRVRTWLHCTVSPLRNEQAVIEGALIIARDMTETKRTELRLRRSEQMMVDTQGTAHLGTWDWDVTEPVAVWSEELYRIYDLTPETYTPSYEEYLTKVHPDNRQRVIDATNRVFQQHIPYSHDERILRPDGSIRWLHTWAFPVLAEDGTLVRLVGVCQDITDRVLAEEAVRDLNDDLEQRVAERTLALENSLRDLEAFNAMVSHDLRAPLTVIQMTNEVLRLDWPGHMPPVIAESLETIDGAVTHMSSLVTDLLALARVGNTPVQRVDIDVTALCKEIVGNLRRAAPDRQVQVQIAPGLRFYADAALVRTAFDNLLSNAWKYTSRTERAAIEVGTALREGAPAVFVRDNGAGFDTSEAHRLFQPFERLHAESEFEGTGVGLAAVHRIAERHGGQIWAESEQGRGATFYLDLGQAAPEMIEAQTA